MLFKKGTKEQISEKMTVKELLDDMIDDYTGPKQKEIVDVRRGIVPKDVFMDNAAAHMLKTYGNKSTETDRKQALGEFEQYVFGYYKLQGLLDDTDISDIRIVNAGCVRCKRLGKRETSNIKFGSKEEYKRFIDFVAAKNQINISNVNAIQTFTDNKSHPDYILRFTLSMPILNSVDNAYLHIRKFPRNFPDTKQLVSMGVLSSAQAEYLVNRAKKGSMFICGKSGAGKSILLNAIKEEAITQDRSCLVIQENEEITTKNHPEMIFMHPLVNRGESKVVYTLDELSTAALLMDFDYFIIGEIKGPEAFDMLNASFTGHICLSTCHGESSQKALDKVAVNAQKKNEKLSKTELMQMLASFQTVVYMKDFRVAEISEIAGWQEDQQRIIYRKAEVK